jgi:hypothetical protein
VRISIFRGFLPTILGYTVCHILGVIISRIGAGVAAEALSQGWVGILARRAMLRRGGLFLGMFNESG